MGLSTNLHTTTSPSEVDCIHMTCMVVLNLPWMLRPPMAKVPSATTVFAAAAVRTLGACLTTSGHYFFHCSTWQDKIWSKPLSSLHSHGGPDFCNKYITIFNYKWTLVHSFPCTSVDHSLCPLLANKYLPTAGNIHMNITIRPIKC